MHTNHVTLPSSEIHPIECIGQIPQCNKTRMRVLATTK